LGCAAHSWWSCSSSAFRWLSRPWPSTWPRKETHLVKAGARSCAIICRTWQPWICSWFRPSALSNSTSWSLSGWLGESSSIIMSREFTARWIRMRRFIGRLSAAASSHRDLSLAAFITNIAGFNFRYTQEHGATLDAVCGQDVSYSAAADCGFRSSLASLPVTPPFPRLEPL